MCRLWRQLLVQSQELSPHQGLRRLLLVWEKYDYTQPQPHEKE
jgi:hypothetical protein